ncbi:uncharacterized protein A4U43_C06F5660 [Asparagus officinalis]|uniref:Alliinase C-terminal domain-containing protein n=1 Tax=Asparagus officinalis TaxID=4686 RepID=A0A5P1EN61_ASPOF|nr:uncharacterized protein A4U43_C06F5660 [Asparagus officinalis]
MASAQAKQSQRKLRSLWAQPAIWCIAVLVSLAVNLVSVTYIAPLFEDLGDERNRYKVNIVHEKEKKTVEKNYTAVQDTNISATSGSRPIKDSIINLDQLGYPMKTDYLRSGLFRWAGDARAFKGESYIEVVCSPNNPDGSMNKAVLNSETGKTIHDLAYYWPQYTAITEPADHDIMLFTVSKSTGHAGTRLGWAIVKDPNIAKKMTKFIAMNTIGVSKDSQLRAAKILKVISDGYEHPNTKSSMRLFDFGRDRLAKRWERLREVVKATKLFSLPEYPLETCKFTREKFAAYPAFAWLKCEKEEIEDCESFLKKLKIQTRGGMHFGVDMKYVRVSMLDREETFKLFIERLASLA